MKFNKNNFNTCKVNWKKWLRKGKNFNNHFQRLIHLKLLKNIWHFTPNGRVKIEILISNYRTKRLYTSIFRVKDSFKSLYFSHNFRNKSNLKLKIKKEKGTLTLQKRKFYKSIKLLVNCREKSSKKNKCWEKIKPL